MADVFATLIATTAVAVNIRELSRRIDKGNCAGMFVSPLSATGALPATHWISSGWIPAAYINTVSSPTRLYTVAKKAWEDDGDVFPFTQAQIMNALSKCTLSDGTYLDPVLGLIEEGPHALIARLGLRLAGAPL